MDGLLPETGRPWRLAVLVTGLWTQSQAVDFMANGLEPFHDIPVDVRATMARCCFPRD